MADPAEIAVSPASSRLSTPRSQMDIRAWLLGASAVVVAVGRAALVLPLSEGASVSHSLTLRAAALSLGVNSALALLCAGFGLHCMARPKFFSKALPAVLALAAIIPFFAAICQAVDIVVHAADGHGIGPQFMRAYACGAFFVALFLQLLFVKMNMKLGTWNPVLGLLWGTDVDEGEVENGDRETVLRRYKKEIEMVFVADLFPTGAALVTGVVAYLLIGRIRLWPVDLTGFLVQLAGLALNVRSIRRALAFRMECKRPPRTILAEMEGENVPLVHEHEVQVVSAV